MNVEQGPGEWRAGLLFVRDTAAYLKVGSAVTVIAIVAVITWAVLWGQNPVDFYTSYL